jgi:hypothetical protein
MIWDKGLGHALKPQKLNEIHDRTTRRKLDPMMKSNDDQSSRIHFVRSPVGLGHYGYWQFANHLFLEW